MIIKTEAFFPPFGFCVHLKCNQIWTFSKLIIIWLMLLGGVMLKLNDLNTELEINYPECAREMRWH